MSKNATRSQESTDTELDERDCRALEQYLTVLEDQGDVRGNPGEYKVVSESGNSYAVNTLLGECECWDDRRQDRPRCKHRRRVEFATGYRTIPNTDCVDVDPSLGEHVSSVNDAANEASSEQAIATDGGLTVREAADDAEILEDSESDPWEGPFPEFDKYGEPTGKRYYRCRCCGREALESISRDVVGHRESCRFGGADR
ncbi:hypothetical protein QA600_21580 [Natronococcus sp. A-GB1]|uniref:hypothetical protein n=1 Tax=Natronococcus sp. A-GB1 TaxID=3037648 RepID=UPI00241E4625|nr:hypothetical protein [Natronococcus sp. A-GB1]MDG5761916.1 hypothetical protein [Natronococcus sp. A-GB1]